MITSGLSGLTLAAEESPGASAANTVIDATGELNGIVDQANDTAISGFTIEHAQLEGILVEPPPGSWPASASAGPANLSGVTIEHNVVEHNNLDYFSTTGACPKITDGSRWLRPQSPPSRDQLLPGGR